MPARLNIRVTRDFLDRLEKYCDHHGVDKTAVTRIAITEYLDRHPLPVPSPADRFALGFGQESYEALIDASENIYTECDTDFFVTQLPDGRWAAWDDAELSTARVSYHDSRDDAVAAQHTACAYCHQAIPVSVAGEVPDVDDDDAWRDVAEYHQSDCEWIRTRAHRR